MYVGVEMDSYTWGTPKEKAENFSLFSLFPCAHVLFLLLFIRLRFLFGLWGGKGHGEEEEEEEQQQVSSSTQPDLFRFPTN